MGPLVILRSLPYTYLLGRRILSLTSSMSTIGCIDPATENRRLPSGASSAPATRAGTGCEGAVILATTGGPTLQQLPNRPPDPRLPRRLDRCLTNQSRRHCGHMTRALAQARVVDPNHPQAERNASQMI